VDRIRVSHQDDGGRLLLFKVLRSSQYVSHRHTVVQGDFARSLDRDSLRNGIAERHSQFDEVDARFGDGVENSGCRARVRKAARDEQSHGFLAATADLTKFSPDAH